MSALHSANRNQSTRSVHIKFSHSQGFRLRRSEPMECRKGERLWKERPIVMARPSGTYELIGTTVNIEGLARWVLSHGSDAKAEGPIQLQRQIVAEVRRVLQKYKDKI